MKRTPRLEELTAELHQLNGGLRVVLAPASTRTAPSEASVMGTHADGPIGGVRDGYPKVQALESPIEGYAKSIKKKLCNC
ncbi:uncharacterized protein N7479_005990 [Penicillium vulpinum]|uniref:uncharacterized protein n=1 Tax=Penicillium vulpinum TaxID=29845 RepID=UPI002547E615|nr:uncharacterized protein N7479_005990 [Penicillium vulpinum]KAJ5958840.1 hypothetical protein N7479_005990 [Penicillium vulpinum]